MVMQNSFALVDKDVPRINLTQGFVALVDFEDFETVNQYKWTLRVQRTNCYAGRYVTGIGEISMHRFLLGFEGNLEIDHINRNGLDNRRSNLRFCKPSENRVNSRLWSSNTLGFKGVFVYESNYLGKKRFLGYGAQIRCGGKNLRFYGFDTIEEAALKYDELAFNIYGNFARLNFPKKINASCPKTKLHTS